jgi:TolA-binding protein
MNTLELTRSADGTEDIHYQLACEAICQGDYTTAASEALSCTVLHPYYPSAHYIAGVALLKLGLIDEAEEALLTAVEQQPAFPEAHMKLAHIYRKHRLDFFRLGEHQLLASKAERTILGTGSEPFVAA